MTVAPGDSAFHIASVGGRQACSPMAICSCGRHLFRCRHLGAWVMAGEPTVGTTPAQLCCLSLPPSLLFSRLHNLKPCRGCTVVFRMPSRIVDGILRRYDYLR